MKRVVLLLAFLPATVALGACGAGEVVVQAQLEGDSADAEPIALQDLEVFLLPYDRDVLFDSLAAAYSEPEPTIPDSLLALQDRLAEAQAEWRTLQARWTDRRAELQTLSDSLQGLDRSQPQYVVLFREFNDLEPQVNQLQSQSDAAFERFSELQQRFLTGSERLKAVRAQWANDAFAPVDSIIAARLEELGREEYADTTDAAGVAPFRGIREGEWWVHARYELPYSELYWNVPITVPSGESLQLVLSRENAEVRPLL